MNYSSTGPGLMSSHLSGVTGTDKVDQFIQRFQSTLSRCVQKGFVVDDCFSLIWEETLEEIELASPFRPPVYNELLSWARQQLDKRNLAP